jgi:hypothetical protein
MFTCTTGLAHASVHCCWQQMVVAKQESTNKDLAVMIHSLKASLEAAKQERERMEADAAAALEITQHLQQQLTAALADRDGISEQVAGLMGQVAQGEEAKTQLEGRWVAMLTPTGEGRGCH